jgi:hypothetical protein
LQNGFLGTKTATPHAEMASPDHHCRIAEAVEKRQRQNAENENQTAKCKSERRNAMTDQESNMIRAISESEWYDRYDAAGILSIDTEEAHAIVEAIPNNLVWTQIDPGMTPAGEPADGDAFTIIPGYQQDDDEFNVMGIYISSTPWVNPNEYVLIPREEEDRD